MLPPGERFFYDTETCGYHGPVALIQYAVDDGPINLYNAWKEPIWKTLKLIEESMTYEHVGFNLTFDHFHLCQLYTNFLHYVRNGGDDRHIPQEHIDAIAVCQKDARLGPCLKPRSACDLFLVGRKGKYQSLMDRHDIRLRRVPSTLAWELASELARRVELDDIYFARRKDKHAARWNVYDREDEPDFKDVCLKFHASGALKSLAVHALGYDPADVLEYSRLESDPTEFGWAPFAGANGGKPGNWKDEWPVHIPNHISYWAFNPLGKRYATDDVKYTRELWEFFGRPAGGDHDSTLATMVGAVRWRGYAIDLESIKGLRLEAIERAKKAPRSPERVREYIEPHLSEEEKLVIGGSTKKVILEDISKWTLQTEEELFEMDDWTPDDPAKISTSEVLEDAGSPAVELPDAAPVLSKDPHPAAILAKKVLEARTAHKEVELYDKLIQAGRFHASFKIIGTLSSRMAGADGLNPQGIKKEKKVRQCFPLADEGLQLAGGDFKAFEVGIAEAVYDDPKLREALEAGKKIHGLFAVQLRPDMTYEEVLESEGTEDDWYTKGKQGIFAMMYGGNEDTLKNKLGVSIEHAEKAYAGFINEYPGVGKARAATFNKFCSMRQPGGIGTRVVWHEPHDFVESLFGFRRYFTLENKICKALFDIAQSPPHHWKQVKQRVQRRDRMQTASGAAQSALYACAFGLQASNMRAAANHEIQSSGAQITKHLQCKVWEVQPVGIHPWEIVPMNIHDEVMCPSKPEVQYEVKKKVDWIIDHYIDRIPFLGIDWATNLSSWADKGKPEEDEEEN